MFKKYILAVSGGPDSMAMLDMYHKKAQAVCVVNYNKRQNSDYDVSLVENYCKLHNIKYYVYNVDKKIYKTTKIDNFQSFARKIRYEFFKEVAQIEKNNKLLVAHNLNDHLETAYMQLQKQSKSLFYGIKEKSNYDFLEIYRPLLCYQKKCLQRYCNTHNIKYAIDESNNSDVYERNRVRKIINAWDREQLHKFIKQIKKYNAQNKTLDKKVQKDFSNWKQANFNIDFFKKIDQSEQYYLIYNWLKLFDEKNNSKNKINEIIKFINNHNSKGNYRLEKNKFIVKQNKCLLIK